MLKKIFLVTVCICCLLLIAGCGNSEPDPGFENGITIEVLNNTEDIIISHVLFYGSGLDEWGEDLLGDEVIEPGETFIFVLPEGTYTLIPMTFELYIIPGARNINEDTSIEIGGNGLVPILVRNNTEKDITFLYLLDSDGEELDQEQVEELDQEQSEDLTGDAEDNLEFNFEDGEDILGDEVLPAGLGRFFFIRPGVYDFLGLHYDGEVILFDSAVVIEGEATITID